MIIYLLCFQIKARLILTYQSNILCNIGVHFIFHNDDGKTIYQKILRK